MNVSVARAAAEGRDQNIIRNMFVDFYTTLSEYDPNLVINADGRPTWEPAGVEESESEEGWWRLNFGFRASFDAYIIRVDGVPAGYALVAKEHEIIPEGVDYDLFDFHIAPKFRRQGVGRIAAHQIFDMYRGTWSVFELKENLRARRFWETIIGEYTNGNYENLDGGTQQRFRNQATSGAAGFGM